MSDDELSVYSADAYEPGPTRTQHGARRFGAPTSDDLKTRLEALRDRLVGDLSPDDGDTTNDTTNNKVVDEVLKPIGGLVLDGLGITSRALWEIMKISSRAVRSKYKEMQEAHVARINELLLKKEELNTAELEEAERILTDQRDEAEKELVLAEIGALTSLDDTRSKEFLHQIEDHARSRRAIWPAVDASRMPFVRCMQGLTNMEASKFSGAQAPVPCAFPDVEDAMIDMQIPLWMPEAQVGMQPALLAGLTSALEMMKRIMPPDKKSELETKFVELKSEDGSPGSDESSNSGGVSKRKTSFIGTPSKRQHVGSTSDVAGSSNSGSVSISMKHILNAGGFTPERIIATLLKVSKDDHPVLGDTGDALDWPEHSILRLIDVSRPPPPLPPPPPPPPPPPHVTGVEARIRWAEGVITRLIAAASTLPGSIDPLRAWLFHGMHTTQNIADRDKMLNVALRLDPDPPNHINSIISTRYKAIRNAIAAELTEAVEAAGGAYTDVLMSRLRSDPTPKLLKIPHVMELFRELASIEIRLSDLRTPRGIEAAVDRVRRTRALEAARSMVVCAWKQYVSTL